MYLSIWNKTSSEPVVFKGIEIVPMKQQYQYFAAEDIVTVKEKNFELDVSRKVDSNVKLIVVWSHESIKPSSPQPALNYKDIPTLLIRKEDIGNMLEALSNKKNYRVGRGG